MKSGSGEKAEERQRHFDAFAREASPERHAREESLRLKGVPHSNEVARREDRKSSVNASGRGLLQRYVSKDSLTKV